MAVLGWGIKYPKVNEEDKILLSEIIGTGGLVVSEWEGLAPALWTFPARDRIMAALSEEIYITEAAEKSGALITAQFARDLGRKVWAVPGPITSRVSAGTNRLLDEGKARMWLPQQQHKLNLEQLNIYDANNNGYRAKIYRLLQNETLDIDDLARKMGMPVQAVIKETTLLQLSGLISEKEGKLSIC